MTQVEFIARIRYLGWICYQMGANLPLHDVGPDKEISQERLQSLMEGTEIVLDNMEISPEENHKIWMETKAKQGYVYGDKLDTILKTHPSMVPFAELSEVEKRKDEMDVLMVELASNLFDKIDNRELEE